MVLNAEKRNKLDELIARRKAALADGALLLLLLLLQPHLYQPPLTLKTRMPARALSLRGKGWTMS